MDPNDLIDAVDIAGQIPASFYAQMESKKWSDRKEALEIIEKVTSVPRIQNCDFSELVKVLKKTVAKDSNIVVVTSAARCLCQLAQGLRTNFAPYSNSCLTALFDKFKEKKPNVVTVLRDATDACFVGTNIESIYEDVISFLDNKNPQIKSEMCLFLARLFARYPAQVLNKKTLRPLINALIKTLSDMDSTVRDSSALAIGTAMKVTGDKIMMTLIADVEPIKITKIKECCEKAEIYVAPMNGQSEIVAQAVNGQQVEQVVTQNGQTDEIEEDDEDRVYDMLEAVDVSSQVPASFYAQMESKKWSDRKEALETIEKITSTPKIQNSDFNELVKVLRKTVAKDSNIVVVTSAARCLCQLAQGLRTNFSPYSNSCLTALFEKFKEKKPNVVSVLRDATDACFVGTNIESIYEDVIQFLDNKNPQIKSETCSFLARTFAKFPAQVLNKKTLRPLINALIKTLSDMDSTVRDNAAMAIGTAMKVTGEKLMMTLIADVEPIKIPKIKEFCEKAQVKKIPAAVLNAMNSNTVPAQQMPSNSQPASAMPRSSATMVRSTSNRRLTTSAIGSKRLAPPQAPAASQAPSSNATVKRNATIIKRSTVPKRSIVPPASQHQNQNHQQQQQHNATATSTATNMGPPSGLPQQHLANNAQTLNNNTQPILSTPAKPVYATTLRANKVYKHGNLDMIILRLISDNPSEVMEALNELDDTLNDDSEPDFKNRINQVIDLSCLQLIKSFDGFKSNPSDSSAERIQKVSDLLKKLFARRQLVTAASQQSIRFLLVQLFTLAHFCGNLQTDQGDAVLVRKNLNNLALAIMDGFEPTNIMCILTGLLNEPTSVSIVEPVKDAIIRSMRSFK